jgi:hypothetical protein
MDKYNKMTWRCAIAYLILAVAFSAVQAYLASSAQLLIVPLLFHTAVGFLFYWGFVKQKQIFALMAMAWLLWGGYKTAQVLYQLARAHSSIYIFAGAAATFTFMLIWTYFTFKAIKAR